MSDDFDAALDALAIPVAKHADGMPMVPANYFENVATVTKAGPMPADASRAEKLEHIVDLAVDTISEILQTPIDPYMPDGMKFVSVKKDAAIAALNLAVKVDENHFRKRNQSALMAILSKIADEEKGAPPVILN